MGVITIVRDDITRQNVDVIVNAANAGLRGGGGVDGAIHRTAGPSVLEECRKIGGCSTGDAVMTNGGRLKAGKVIHAVGPVWKGGKKKEAELLRRCYCKSFDLAKENGLKRIALPAISTGVYGYPLEPATRIAIEEGLKYQGDFEEIRYVCFSEEDMNIYSMIYQSLTAKQ